MMKSTGMFLCLAMLFGCATGSRELTADKLPQPFELTFAMRTTDGRATRYQFGDDAMLLFSGGMRAYSGADAQAGKLTDDQRLAVWQSLLNGNLLRSGSAVFARPDVVQYDLTVRAGKHHSTLTVLDPAPGSPDAQALSHLNALLFGYQADMRYGQVIRPIEVELEKKK